MAVKNVHKIIIVGQKNVGKSTLMEKYAAKKTADSETADNEKGKNSGITWMINNKELNIEFKIIDPDEYAALRDSYFRSASGFICLFAVDNAESFELVQKIREQILDVRSQTKLILIGNKCDLPKSQREVKKSQASKLAKKWKSEYLEMSIVNNHNVDNCLTILLQAIVDNKHTGLVRQRRSLKQTMDRFKYYNCFQ